MRNCDDRNDNFSNLGDWGYDKSCNMHLNKNKKTKNI
jgi:hypothetical protein